MTAASYRLDHARENVRRDQEAMLRVVDLEREHHRLLRHRPGDARLEEIGWLLQELRVALFAQPIGARGPVSEKRVRAALREALEAV